MSAAAFDTHRAVRRLESHRCGNARCGRRPSLKAKVEGVVAVLSAVLAGAGAAADSFAPSLEACIRYAEADVAHEATVQEAAAAYEAARNEVWSAYDAVEVKRARPDYQAAR